MRWWRRGKSEKREVKLNRLRVVAFLSLFGFVVLGARIFYLQVLRHSYYAALAESQRRRAVDLLPRRGKIYVTEGGDTKNLFPLATLKKQWIVFAVPREMEHFEETAEKLAPILVAWEEREKQRAEKILRKTGQLRGRGEEEGKRGEEEEKELTEEERIERKKEELLRRLADPTDPYEPLIPPTRVLDEQAVEELRQAKLPGVVLKEVERRFYPEGMLAAHVVGFVGERDNRIVGQYGLEGYFEEELRGEPGYFTAERDQQGNLISIAFSAEKPARDGADLILTIDRAVQKVIEQEARWGMERYRAERATVIVMEPFRGAILGLAVVPSFEPNRYYYVKDIKILSNPAVAENFEPGSVLKPLVMAAAMDAGLVEPSDTVIDDGPIHIGPYTIDTYDGKHHGRITMTQVLEQSNNIGMVRVAQKIGTEKLYEKLRRFGLGERTGIELSGEAQGRILPPEEWSEARLATVAFGQGIATTPLQLITATAALINGGKLMRPYLVQEKRYPDGRVERTEPKMVRQVLKPEVADQLRAMLISVVEKGVGQLAKVPGYYVGGKTGTAQVPSPQGGYEPDKKIISFVGFAPSHNPRFLVLIKLDNPAGLSFASGTAAPMFRRIMERLLQSAHIPPTRPLKSPLRR
jgi:cell division protein FtsI/penicillin-binding protein 2